MAEARRRSSATCSGVPCTCGKASSSASPSIPRSTAMTTLLVVANASDWHSRHAIFAVVEGVADHLMDQTGLPCERIGLVYNPGVEDDPLAAAPVPLDHPWLAPRATDFSAAPPTPTSARCTSAGLIRIQRCCASTCLSSLERAAPGKTS